MYKGRLVNLLEASLIGFELIYIDKKKKLTKLYKDNESISYNVSISIDSTNKISKLEIVQIKWGKNNKSEIIYLDNYPDEIKRNLDIDIKKITEI